MNAPPWLVWSIYWFMVAMQVLVAIGVMIMVAWIGRKL